MATLQGKTPKSTFEALLKLESGGLDENLKTVQDGTGNDSPLRLSRLSLSIHDLTFPSTGAIAGKVLGIAEDGTTMEWIDGGGSSGSPAGPLGSIKVSDGTSLSDLTVGANGRVLMADSTAPLGVKWASLPPNNGGGEPTVDVASYTYNDMNSIDTVVEQIGENQRITTYTYNQAGAIDTITINYLGVTRVETYTYIAGRVQSMTASYP